MSMIPVNRKFLRGDIYYANLEPHLGSEQGGIRPVVVVQNNTANCYSPNLIVAPVTSNIGKKPDHQSHVLVGGNRAFVQPSMILGESILVIRGVSALDKELLGTLVAEAKDALETLEKQLVQAQEEYDEATKTAKRSNYICNELFTWADVYDTANHDERRAILQQFIKEIRVRKDYEISITLNASFNQVEQLKAVSTYDGAGIFEEISEKGA